MAGIVCFAWQFRENGWPKIKKMTVEFNSSGLLAKITAIGEDDRTVYIDFRNGKSGSFNTTQQRFTVGDVLLISGDIENNIDVELTKMSGNAWPDDLWVGVVKIKCPDITVIESGGRFRTVPTRDTVPYDVGNTVHAGEVQGVSRVLLESQITYIDLPQVDDTVIAGFLAAQTSESELGFDDFGGLPAVVARARELIEIPLQKNESLAVIGARPIKGVLFTGEPGTGKTMLARIIASRSSAAFYEISGPAIFSKWYGQSEELLRKLFMKAAEQQRAIIFFDEIDSVAAQRGDGSHEASKRVVAQLLTLMDGFTPDNNVVVIAATNRPQDLDIALRRPGRFDWEIEFPYPEEDDRLDILLKTARRLSTSNPLPHAEIAERTSGWSAAELAHIWNEAALLAVQDRRDKIFEEDYFGGFERVSRYRLRLRQVGQNGDSR